MSQATGGIRRLRLWLPWVGVALAAGFAAVAGSYLAVGRRPAFVVTPADRFVLAVSPDALVAFAITELGDLGQDLALLAAIALVSVLLGLTALPGILAIQDGRLAAGAVLGVALPALTTLVLTRSPASSAGSAAGAGLVVATLVAVAVGGTWERTPARDSAGGAGGRRQVLGAIGAALGLGALSVLVRGTGETDGPPGVDSPSGVDVPEDARPPVRELLTEARSKSLPVEGLEPLVSTDFFEVDINNINPIVEREEWTLSVTGAVATEVEIDFADVEAMAFEDRFATLRCVGDYLNGPKMDNALWGGVPMEEILAVAEPRGERVILHAADGYFNDFPIEALWPGLLAYEMNGHPLPPAHGAPARALVPGHWGEVNVKWLTEIEVVDEDVEGYWEQRGWQGTGPVTTVAKLWQVNHLDDGRIEVAGHAYAGTRGVRAVEVSTDGGETWTGAELTEPLPGDDVWRQWRHRYLASEPHDVVVRAIDGTGTLQARERTEPKPSGATGWVSQTVEPR